jgi:hypothetical protein
MVIYSHPTALVSFSANLVIYPPIPIRGGRSERGVSPLSINYPLIDSYRPLNLK